jgi:hypothetical protein
VKSDLIFGQKLNATWTLISGQREGKNKSGNSGKKTVVREEYRFSTYHRKFDNPLGIFLLSLSCAPLIYLSFSTFLDIFISLLSHPKKNKNKKTLHLRRNTQHLPSPALDPKVRLRAFES